MSNRLTFSLASLIFLIAFGLVFAPVSVMAHEPGGADAEFVLHHDGLGSDADTPGTGTAAQLTGNDLVTETGHTHRARPTVSNIELVDVKIGADKAARDKATAESTVKGTSVLLVNDVTPAADGAVTKVTTGADGKFRVKITFSENVYADSNQTVNFGAALTGTPLANDVIGASFITDSAASQAAPGIQITALTVGEVSRVTGSSKAFYATITVPTANLASVPMDAWIAVSINAVYSKGKFSSGDSEQGRGNAASSQYKFSVVKTFPVAPDTTAPTVTIDAPSNPESNGDLKFTVKFDEALAAASKLGGLQLSDFNLAGGSATDAGLTGPTSASTATNQIYELLVTPDTPTSVVTVSLKANSVTDAAGNILDHTTAGATATYDKIPPTVLSHTAAKNTALTGNYLDITFTFSEAVQRFTVDAIDSGAQTQNVEIVTSNFGPTQGETADIWTITLKVVDTAARSSVRLKVGTNAVKDLAGNSLAETYLASVSALDNSDPFFADDAAPTGLPGGLCVGDTLPDNVLPLANDNEGDPLTYTLTRGNVSVPNARPATAGFYWETTDAQTRVLKGTATLADGGTYTWTVTDSQGAMDTVTFTIIVKPLQIPETVTGLTAKKVDSASMQLPTKNKVKLTWTTPADKKAYDDCIPDVTGYTVAQTKLNELTGRFDADGTHTFLIADTVSSGTKTSYTIPEDLPSGIYQFTITATNSVGDGPPSIAAVWEKTGGTRVVVADPPKWDPAKGADLRAAVDSDGNHVTVNWLKVPDLSDGGAPVYDDMVAATHADYASQKAKRDKFYGSDVTGDFAGYTVYMINQATQNITRYPKALPGPRGNPAGTLAISDYATTVSPYDHPTYRVGPLAPGQYVFRVTAMNVAGESARSVSTIYATVTIVNPLPGTTLPPAGTGDVATAAYNSATGVTTISSGTVAANGFIVVDAAALPDLELFFAQGGTITLMDPATAAAKTVVISEILWGLDFGEPAAAQKNKQFIELYNTNISGAVNLAGWKLVFKQGRPAPANDVDQVSNVAGAGWVVDVGQSGRVAGTTLFGGTVPPTELISMYRKINYAKVQNTDGGDVAKRLEGVPGGNAKGSWAASTRVTTQTSIKSSPGRRHFVPVSLITATAVPRSPFVINEIGNGTGGTNDWVELRNVTDEEQSLKNYQLSVVTSDKKDTQLFHFHDKDYKVPAKGVILVASTNPENTDIAAGVDVARSANDQDPTGVDTLYVVRSFDLPDSGQTLLILRKSAKSHEKQHLGTDKDIIDVVGTLKIEDPALATSLWPLKAIGAPHGNVIDGTDDEDFRAGKVYERKNASGGTGEKHLAVRGYTGIGYDRVAANSDVNGGTPGYDNGAHKEYNDANVTQSAAPVTISEIMLDVATGRRLPQWIELYNSSMTSGVKLDGWKLSIENANDVDTALNATITLGAYTIAPNQTVLIVTTSGRMSDADHFPNTRVINLWTTKAHRDALQMKNRNVQAFSTTGFYFELVDKAGKLVDEVGNLDGSRRTRDEPAWALPMGEDDDRRSSLIRRYDRGTASDGTMANGWISADTTDFVYAISDTYYGDPDDFGTPGFRGGGPLPVSLSKFRPERLDDGSIVVRWITESELNNAGFNILRSETKDGEYTKLNTQLIKGQGTTSERATYAFPDTSAKPNVVYYYQIQDVSLDGDVTTLRVSRLKGHISAAGKATTTWGELKALQ